VLENARYVKCSRANAGEVVCMEELDRALSEKAKTVRTYRAKDPYGDDVEYLKEFPGLTLDDLRQLSNNEAILRFMGGKGKIPYTAIVDPHTGKAMETIEGKPTVKSLTAAIKRARAMLEKKHGKGLDRSLWEEIGEVERKIDRALVEKNFVEALEMHGKLAAKLPRPVDEVKLRLSVTREMIEKDVAELLASGKADNKELAKIADALGECELRERIRNSLG